MIQRIKEMMDNQNCGKIRRIKGFVNDGGWIEINATPQQIHTNTVTKGQKVLIVDDIFDTGMTVNALVGTVMNCGIPREDIKVAVYDYKIPLFKHEEPLPIQPDYWCRKHVLEKPEDERWIHYTCHEFIGLTHDEVDEVYSDSEVRTILHTILED